MESDKIVVTRSYGKIFSNGTLTGRALSSKSKMAKWMNHYPATEIALVAMPGKTSDEIIEKLRQWAAEDGISFEESTNNLPDELIPEPAKVVEHKYLLPGRVFSYRTDKELIGDKYTLTLFWRRNGFIEELSLRELTRKRSDKIGKTIKWILEDTHSDLLHTMQDLTQLTNELTGSAGAIGTVEATEVHKLFTDWRNSKPEEFESPVVEHYGELNESTN